MLFTIDEKLRRKYSNLKVAGDLHGDWLAFKAIENNFDSENDILIFLGDYADRGDFGLEIIETLYAWQKEGHENIIMLKGNHELYSPEGLPRFRPCDLIYEAEKKRDGWNSFFRETLHPFIKSLYHAALLPGEILFVHAGVSEELISPEALKNPDSSMERQLLWSDPTEEDVFDRFNTLRGEGVLFGEKLTKEVCSRLGIKRIFRSHQPMLASEKPHLMHDGRLITTQSTSSYHGKPCLLNISLKNPDAFGIIEL